MPLLQSRYLPLFVLILLVGASAGLYVPWIDNPLVFDDPNLLKSPSLGDFAVMPFSLQPRQFPYFTLGFEQVISNGNLHVSRYVALLLHGLNGFLLFLLSRRLLARATTDGNRATFLAFAAGLLFVVHPVSVYAAGYLIQRTILFATFFLLLSAIQFDKALTEGSWRRAIFAGLCYGMAAMSKEHAMPGFLVVSALIFLCPPADRISSRKPLLAFLATSLPIAAWIALIKLGYVATAYEPDIAQIIGTTGFPDTGSRLGNWALSAALQCGFFFRYTALWLWPAPAGMSIDIRPDLPSLSQSLFLYLAPLALGILISVVLYTLVVRRKVVLIKFSIIAYGLAWVAILYFVELSTIRFQEPVVLYRSYLWAPGLVLVVAIALSYLSNRRVLLLLITLTFVSAFLATNRLEKFSSGLALWEEAEKLMAKEDTPGAARIHFNKASYLRQQGNHGLALEEFTKVIQLAPDVYQGYWGRSRLWLSMDNIPKAKDDTEKTLSLNPSLGSAYFQLGFIYKKLGKTHESKMAFQQAQKLGFPVIELE